MIWSCNDNIQYLSPRSAAISFTLGKMVAPRFWASLAFKITSRESSTQQSEYSNARLNFALRGAPSSEFSKFNDLVGGNIFRPPSVS